MGNLHGVPHVYEHEWILASLSSDKTLLPEDSFIENHSQLSPYEKKFYSVHDISKSDVQEALMLEGPLYWNIDWKHQYSLHKVYRKLLEQFPSATNQCNAERIFSHEVVAFADQIRSQYLGEQYSI